MSGSQHRINPQQNQHVQQALLDSANTQRLYNPHSSGVLNEDSSAIMDPSSYQDFFAFGGISDQNQNHMIGMPDVGFGHNSAGFSAHHGLSSSAPPISHDMNAMHGMPSTAFGAESNDGSGNLDTMDDAGGREQLSPTEHSFEDTGADEFGLPGHNLADGTDLGVKGTDDKTGAPPAWSELKTKAGKDRKRLPLACIACRRKKIRCSGEKPACKHCQRSRIPCVYKVTTRKAAPRTDYMAMLDKRLKRMEDRIIKIIPKTDQEPNSSITRAMVKPAIPGSAPGSKATSKKRGADEAFGSDLEAWARAASKNQNDGSDDGLQAKDDEDSEETQLFREGIDALPPKDVQEHMAEVFFDNVYGQAYHLLHKPSYIRKLKNNTLPPVLILSVCAVAARFAPNPNASSTSKPFLRGEEWASHARDICTRRYESPNMTILTCLLILGLHEFGTCHGGRSWALGGQAIRMAFALQLHKDLEYDPARRGHRTPLSFVDREIRRRTMWACFLMDRFNSSGSDRPMFVKEESIRIQLPVKESYFQLDMPAQTETLDGNLLSPGTPSQKAQAKEHMGVAAHSIRAIAVWGRIVAYFDQGGKEADSYPIWDDRSGYMNLLQQAENLQQLLPEPLRYSADNLSLHVTERTASQYLLLHLSIQQNILFIHKAGVTLGNSRAGKKSSADFLAQASAKTVAAANKISEVLRDAEQAKCALTAPFAGYCAFSATNVHILGIFSGKPTVKSAAEVNAGINIKFLRKTMRYWGMFHWMVENIRSQYRNALEASRSGKLGTQGSARWPVLQYSDWFNRYPHGVSELDVVEPTSQRKRDRGEDAVLEQKPELQSVDDFFSSLASPSSTDSRAASQGPINKRKPPYRKPTDMGLQKVDTGIKDTLAGQSATGQPRIQAPQQHQQQQQQQSRQTTHLGGQSSGPGPVGYNPVTLPHSQGQVYAAMSPLSPAQVNPFGFQGQSPFFSSDMLQLNAMAQQSNNMSHGLDGQLPFGGYSVGSGSQDMMNGNVANWGGGSKPQSSAKMLPPGHRDMKMNTGADSASHSRNQGQIGAEGLSGFNGSDLPSGWFMPFNMEPPQSQDMNLSSETGATGDNIDPFGSAFGNNSMNLGGTSLDELQHT